MQVAEKERMPRLSLGEERNMVTQLLLLNITVFILLFFIKIIYQMENTGLAAFERDIMANTQFPADPKVLLTKPWTPLTAMFAHTGFWDVFSNLVWLFCFGSILQNIGGFRLIVPVYLFGGLSGMAFFMAGINLVPGLRVYIPSGSIIGAGAGVMAMAVGVTTLAPRHRVFPLLLKGGIPVWVLSVVFLALHITSLATSDRYPSIAGSLFLLGGAFMGFMFIAQYKKGRNWGAPVNKVIFNAGHIFHPKEQKEILKEEYLEPSKPTATTPFQKVGTVPEHKLNELLDKINDQGLQSLTPEERETLLRASKENGEDY
ncbi:rhomboid family intramembrane serine protease [Chitinophaga lutea]|uniref:Rhomboid family intramembrane serine protease n=1 Tax=Chitinophaga lutea TaxID=2488634 RepID=A0A3N4Q2C2_9BACT|nr:rhomboid family intramembrane serine protease [Chitinophaga lutea]RPE13725.1 rhomboid family intramembrane serine protease [Chitinophaga lutea]